MFKAKKEKIFPPGTFIGTKARVAAIIQLCLAFTLFLWIASQPFMPDFFAVRSKMLILETVFGTRALTTEERAQQTEEQQQRNRKRFSELPIEERKAIELHYKDLQEISKKPFKKKLLKTAELLTLKTGAFLQAWILFSIIISILLLLQIEGATLACWLLPLLAILAAVEPEEMKAAGRELYPSEEVIIETFLREPLKPSIADQRDQLKKGWELYLIQKWALERPAQESSLYLLQLEKGEFSFYLDQAKRQASAPISLPSDQLEKCPSSLLLLYIAWNFIFALSATFGSQATLIISSGARL